MPALDLFDSQGNKLGVWDGELKDRTPSGTTAARDIAFAANPDLRDWYNTTLGYKEWYNLASAQWEMDQRVINGGVVVYGMARAGEAIQLNTEYAGFYCTVAGSTASTFAFVDGGSVSFTPVVGQQYDWHGQFTVMGTSMAGIGHPVA